VPKYRDLHERLLQLVQTELHPDDSLPSERQLSERLQVSRVTVRHALAELVQGGHIYRIQGKGTFVAKAVVRKQMTLTSFSEDMAARGLVASSKILVAQSQPAGAAVGQALVISPTESVWRLERLRLADGDPMCLEQVYLPERVVGDISSQLDEGTSLYQVLRERGIRVVRAEQQLKPTVVSPSEADLLSVPPLSPSLLTVRITYDSREQRVEYAKSLYRGDRYSIEVNLCRS
jgi:GntR family transcriptional regulator